MSKNNSINFWRVIFTISIVIYHFAGKYKQFNSIFNAKNGWRFAVEFFFIVSGFLLAYKCEYSDISAWEYTKHRFKRLFPIYFISLIMISVFNISNNSDSFKSVISYIYNLTDELMLLQGLGWHYVSVNGPAWYISVLLIWGYFIFYMLRKHKDYFSHFWAPLICIVVYSYINQKMGKVDGFMYDFSDVLGLSLGMLRGLAGMCAGVVSYEFYKKFKEVRLTNFGTAASNFGEIFGFCFVLAFTFFKGSTQMDFYFVIVFIFCTAFAFSRKKERFWFKNRVIEFFSKISFSIYIVHYFILNIFLTIYSPKEFSWKVFVLYLISTILLGVFCDYVCDVSLKQIEKMRKKNGGFFIKRSSVLQKK